MLKTTEQWWSEEDGTFEGTPMTKYDWPQDRLLTFKRSESVATVMIVNKQQQVDADFVFEGNFISVPIFNIMMLSAYMRQIIQAHYEYNYEYSSPKTAHLHLFEIKGNNMCGIMVCVELW